MMGEISVRASADELARDFENASMQTIAEINRAVKTVAYATRGFIASEVHRIDPRPKNKIAYLENLQLTQLGVGEFLIHLEGKWPNDLESGFSIENLTELLLSSKSKISKGKNAGKPWVRSSRTSKTFMKNGMPSHFNRYAYVPFQHHPYSEASNRRVSKMENVAEILKQVKVRNERGRMQSFMSKFTDAQGNPLQGKVASIGEVPDVPNNFLDRMVKYQTTTNNRTESIYMTYRTVSDKNPWRNPKPFSGYQIFPKAEEQARKQIEDIVQKLLAPL